MNKIIFLDIDGPMKPARCYFDDDKRKAHNGGWDQLSVAIVNKICKQTGAKIVFNTAWNYKDILTIGKEQGLTGELIGKTLYPKVECRLEAINNWLNMHPAEQIDMWIALDDCHIDHDNAILVDSHVGISLNNYRKATKLLGNEDKFIILM